MEVLKRYSLITVGCAVYATGFALFLEPVNLAAGGVSGIAVIIVHFLDMLDSGSVIFMLNLPLLITGAVVFGGKFFFGTIWATAASSGMISLFEHIMQHGNLSEDRFLCAMMGALLTGAGMGLIFRYGATTGGTDIVVRLIQRKIPHLKTGYIFLLVDSAIVITAGFVFRDAGTAVYSGISLAVNIFILNLVIYGTKHKKQHRL